MRLSDEEKVVLNEILGENDSKILESVENLLKGYPNSVMVRRACLDIAYRIGFAAAVRCAELDSEGIAEGGECGCSCKTGSSSE